MTAHDPRVTLTEAEAARILGHLPPGSAAREWVLPEVERIIAARLAPVRTLADLLIEQGDEHVDGCEGQADCAACVHHDLVAALDAPVSASQDHDGAVHNHPPYEPTCNERRVDGQLRGACLNDDGSPR